MGLKTFFAKLFGIKQTEGYGRSNDGEGTRLMCMDCKRSFMFEPGEQKFFKMRGLTPPKRCPSCRSRKRRRR